MSNFEVGLLALAIFIAIIGIMLTVLNTAINKASAKRTNKRLDEIDELRKEMKELRVDQTKIATELAHIRRSLEMLYQSKLDLEESVLRDKFSGKE